MNCVQLGMIADLRAGFGFPREFQGRTGGDYPFAKVGDISRAGRSGLIVLDTADHYVDEMDLARLKSRPVPPGSTLFAKIGEAIRQEHRVMAGCPMIIDNNAMAAVPKNGVNPQYLFRLMQTIKLYDIASSTTVPSIRKSDLEATSVSLPSLDEQRRIADILGKVDALRAKCREAINHLDALSQSVFHAMFDDSNAALQSTLSDVLRNGLRNGLSPSTSGTVRGEVLTLSAITGSELDLTQKKVGLFDHDFRTTQIVRPGQILICRGNGNKELVGKGKIVREISDEVGFPDTIISGDINTDIVDPAFLQAVWDSPDVRGQIAQGSRTTNGTFKVNQTLLRSISFPLPPMGLQQEFAGRVSAIQSLKATHRAQLGQLENLFLSLQDRAFKG
ncbi:restriction endonuclease subunit S [Kocuria sabuli]|uniref:restriction endonuclease subunit S n=1 Tax=Kocuria sabuli TaxID=3071448 RepID=UPI0034D4E23E